MSAPVRRPALPALLPLPSPAAGVLDSLAAAITAEVRLLEDLVAIMRSQRAAVADDDLQGVDDSVFAIHRVLVTMGEARRHRRALHQLLGTSDDLAPRELEEVLGTHMTDELRTVRDALRATAHVLSQEVQLNRQVLREALSAGSDLVRALYGVAEAPGTYGVQVRGAEAETPGGVLINRRA